MVERKYRKKIVNPITTAETNRNSLNLSLFSAQDLAILEALKQKSKNPQNITYHEINYAFSFYIPHMIENVYQYQVEIESTKSEKLRKIIFKKFFSNNFPNVAFDGVQLAYSPQRLETTKIQRKIKIVHPVSEREEEFMVTIQEDNDCEIPIKQDLKNHLNSPKITEPARATLEAFTTILMADLPTMFQTPHAPIFSSFFVSPSVILRQPWDCCHELWFNFHKKKTEEKRKDEIFADLEDILTQDMASATNAEYIQETLSRMDMDDFLYADEKYPKFQVIAKKYFPPRRESLTIYGREQLDVLSFNRLSKYLSIFGHLIKSIDWREGNRNMDEKYFKMFAKFCGKTLIKFEIREHYFNFNQLAKFQVLEELAIYKVSFSYFGSIPSLKKLKLLSVNFTNFEWLSENFPKLENFGLVSIHGIRDDMIIDFQKHNPQLRSLFINASKHSSITSSIFKDIAVRTPNIEELICMFESENYDNFEMNALHLSGLQKLKHLEILGVQLFSTKPLIDSLANNAIPIEYLDIRLYCASDLVENLPKLKQLKTARIFECSQETLINSIKEMPCLERIYIQNFMEATVPGLLEILESVQNVNLTLYNIEASIDCELSIDLNEYNSILALVKDHHLKVVLHFYDADIDVPDDILEANDNCLEIKV